MSSTALLVDGLSKQYQLGERVQFYNTLRDTIMETAAKPYRAVKRMMSGAPSRKEDSILWALKDVSFEVKQGEVIGLIGRNGAGKSTLLKVLSRITEPTHGKADIFGHVGSLLEVGTGFHNELTGRENIYLNGAILGMKRHDIDRHFDSIVSFAEVEKFVDTPVKHYSSGMYLRLAFAVAAHLEPEILMVDEVLAVGDLAFQKKCLGKMSDVAKQGRTILFVSHNMGAVRSLCSRGIVLNQGGVVADGDIASSIETYYRLTTQDQEANTPGSSGRMGFSPIKLVSHEKASIQQSESMEAQVTLNLPREVAGFNLLCILDDMHQRRVFHIRKDSPDFGYKGTWQGSYTFNVKLPAIWLEPGLYSLYFKAIMWGHETGGKVHSDVLHLDVGGESCGYNSILSPNPKWAMEQVCRG